MKHAKWLLLIVLLASLVLGLAACGGDKETEPESPSAEKPTEVSQAEPTAEPTMEPTKAPEPTTPPTDTPLPEPSDTPESEEEEVEEALDTSSLSSTADLSSFRSTMNVTMVVDNNGQEEEQTIEMLIEYTSEPPAQHIVMSGAVTGPEGEGGTVEMYLVEGTMYMKMEDQWLSMPATEEDIDLTMHVKINERTVIIFPFPVKIAAGNSPRRFALYENYPNPFNPVTDIKYEIIDGRYPIQTTLKIFNVLGQEVRTLVDEIQEPGLYTATWDGRDTAGREVGSGIYFYRLTVEDFTSTKRMLLLK